MSPKSPPVGCVTSRGCGPKPPQGHAGSPLGVLVRCFLATRRAFLHDEMARYKKISKFEDRLDVAARSELKNRKMHQHQRRIGRETCRRASRVILRRSTLLRGCRNFDDLHDRIREIGLPLDRIGDLYCYDVAHRVGQNLRLEPKKVYLHCGTRDGAEALRLDCRKDSLEMSELPAELQVLRPAEAEDFLCICKKCLRLSRTKQTGGQSGCRVPGAEFRGHRVPGTINDLGCPCT